MIEIIEKIISKLKETSYSIFNDESTTYEEAKEYAEETISDAIRSFVNYACCVAHMQRMIQVWVMSSRYEGQEFRDKVEDLDHKRRIAHDAAISNLSMLNRICDMLNIEKFEVNLKDRYEVGNWIGMFCAELYDNRMENVTDADTLTKQVYYNGNYYQCRMTDNDFCIGASYLFSES